jgi:hypothetical protein
MIEWRSKRFEDAGLWAHEAASMAVRACISGWLREAAENLQRNGSIDTGALRASGYFEVGHEGAARSKAISKAREKFSTKGRKSQKVRNPSLFQTSPEEWRPETDLDAKGVFTMEYATYVEDRKPFEDPAFQFIERQAERIAERAAAAVFLRKG